MIVVKHQLDNLCVDADAKGIAPEVMTCLLIDKAKDYALRCIAGLAKRIDWRVKLYEDWLYSFLACTHVIIELERKEIF